MLLFSIILKEYLSKAECYSNKLSAPTVDRISQFRTTVTDVDVMRLSLAKIVELLSVMLTFLVKFFRRKSGQRSSANKNHLEP
jgi:hypothetical protein